MKYTIEDYINLYLTLDQADLPSAKEVKESKKDSLVVLDKDEWLPLLAFDNVVLFPEVFTHFSLKGKKIITFIKEAYEKNGKIGVIAQKNKKKDIKSICTIGTQARIHKIINLPENQTIVILQGEKRFEVRDMIKEKDHFKARVTLLEDDLIDLSKPANKALVQSIRETTIKTFSLTPDIPSDVQSMVENIKNPVFLTYYIASNMSETRHKQKLLETKTSVKRAKLLLTYMIKNLEFTKLKHKIQHQAHTDINNQQRELYIRQQIKVLQKELGDAIEPETEIQNLQNKAKKITWPKEAQEQFDKILRKANRTHPSSPDYATFINYAQVLIDMPWKTYTKDRNDIAYAKKILDQNHYGMEKAKKRILQILAVYQLTQKTKGKVLCLISPPGTGKTTLCQAVAKSLNKKCLKMSLGGLQDAVEFYGHRKTYVGAMLGRLLGQIKNAKVANPVFILDEIDKLDNRRGDPASALLEILDPNQNQTFIDNYLEVPFDLSKVLFIATANDRYAIPPALADRMEFIEMSGYNLEEKLQIAKKHLIPQQRKTHGLNAKNITLNDPTITTLIEKYTSESGVRELTQRIGEICGEVARKLVTKEEYTKKITPKDLIPLLGPEKYDIEEYEKINTPGVGIGLAWTSVGGEILFIEAALTKGEGKLTISGQLGEVMEESATAAYTYIKTHSQELGINDHMFQKYDLHIHVPDGATPKDGPSAGITICSVIASVFTQRKFKEKTAMTGEITLRGTILPVGGIKEKILAAKRADINTIILSEKNKKDVQEIKPNYIKNLTFHYLNHVDQLLPLALEKQQIKNPKKWNLEKTKK